MLLKTIRIHHLLFAMMLVFAGGIGAEAQQTPETPAVDKSPAASVEADLPTILLDAETDLATLEILMVPLSEEELARVAAAWRTIVRAHATEDARIQVRIVNGTEAERKAAREASEQLSKSRGALFAKYRAVLDAWEAKGADPKQLQKHRTYIKAVLTEGLSQMDPIILLRSAWSWISASEGGIAVLVKIAVFAAAIYALIIAARVVRLFVRPRIGRIPNISRLLQAFLVTVIYWIVLSFGLMIVLGLLGIDVSPLFALFGGASFIIGFAMQDTLGNLANGLMIMVNRPFDEGDFVTIGGTSGTVKSVSIVATKITTPDNKVIVIPNKQVWGNAITNFSASKTRRVDLVFGIGYGDDVAKAIEVLREAVAAHPLTLGEPKPLFAVGELGASSVDILCYPWVKTPDYWTVYWDLMADVKNRFDAAGISIPYPQQDVHLHGLPPAARGGGGPQ